MKLMIRVLTKERLLLLKKETEDNSHSRISNKKPLRNFQKVPPSRWADLNWTGIKETKHRKGKLIIVKKRNTERQPLNKRQAGNQRGTFVKTASQTLNQTRLKLTSMRILLLSLLTKKTYRTVTTQECKDVAKAFFPTLNWTEMN